MERNSLEGKVVGVTGGASGIGLGIARKLLAVGAKVAVADLSEGLEEFQNNPNLIYTKVNVTSREQVHNWIQEIVQRFGRLDGICPNAGICPIEKGIVSDEIYHDIMDVCVTGVWITGSEAYYQFKKQGGGGAIVVTASTAGLRVWRNMAVYNTAKHAVVGLAKSWALDWAHEGIRVNAILPGFTESAITARVAKEHPDVKKHLIDAIPLGRAGLPENQADSVLFLLSDAASNVTGTMLACDGGQLLG